MRPSCNDVFTGTLEYYVGIALFFCWVGAWLGEGAAVNMSLCMSLHVWLE